VRILRQRNAADVHAQQARDDDDRQCNDSHDCQGEEAAVGLCAT
jgi:hypothetical protein